MTHAEVATLLLNSDAKRYTAERMIECFCNTGCATDLLSDNEMHILTEILGDEVHDFGVDELAQHTQIEAYDFIKEVEAQLGTDVDLEEFCSEMRTVLDAVTA